MPETAPDAATSAWPDPVEILNPTGSSAVLLLCEHAARHIPGEYDGLGLGAAELDGHIAWDICARALTRQLSERLDAAAFLGTYSRLLIDLNRPLDVASSIPVRSEAFDIPGNTAISAEERARRADRIFTPFHDSVAAAIEARRARGRATIIVAVHSFTPVFLGKARPWHAGILFGEAKTLGEALVRRLGADGTLHVGANEPYRVSREEDYAIPLHGDRLDIPAVLVEIRNDGLATADGVEAWSERLAAALHAEALALAA